MWHVLCLQSFDTFLSGCLPVKKCKVYHIFVYSGFQSSDLKTTIQVTLYPVRKDADNPMNASKLELHVANTTECANELRVMGVFLIG